MSSKSDNQEFTQTCRQEIQDFVKCNKYQLRHPTEGHESGDISECNSFATRYAECIKSNRLIPKGERMGSGQKLEPPPPCEMEASVYGQCLANLLDNEVRRHGGETVTSLDTNRCKFTLAAYDKCMKSPNVESRMVDDPQSQTYQAGQYYWMSSIYWQAPSKS